jgi:hypothetical protein
LLTALTAVLGLIPLAIGLNFDFFSLITDLNPHVFLGGDNVIFWDHSPDHHFWTHLRYRAYFGHGSGDVLPGETHQILVARPQAAKPRSGSIRSIAKNSIYKTTHNSGGFFAVIWFSTVCTFY